MQTQTQTQTKYIEFRKKRSFDQVLNTTFIFLKYNFKRFFQSFFTIGGPIILLTGIAYGMFFFWVSGGIFGEFEPSGTAFDDYAGYVGVGAFIFAIILGFGYILMSGTVYEFMALYQEKGSSENILPAEVWARLKSDLGQLVKATFLLIFLGFAGMAAIAVLVVLIGSISNSNSMLGGITAVVLVPVAMAAVIFLVIRLVLLFPVIIFEKSSPSEGIKRSFNLTSGAFWRTFGIIFLMSVVQSMIGYVILIPQFALTIGTGLGTSSGEIESDTVLQLITAVSYGLYFIVSFALSTLTTVAVGLQYFTLVEENEHSGLMDRISEIGQSPSDLDSSLETY